MQDAEMVDEYYEYTVSILTRPEGRVQAQHGGTYAAADYVSILTRPEGRVQAHAPRRMLALT